MSNVKVNEYTTYYWYCEDCGASEDFGGEWACEMSAGEHECDE